MFQYSKQCYLAFFEIHKEAMDPETPYTNDLAQENSPYLLQHANNPVDWKPWGEEAFQQAEEEGKLVLVSIGYSSCHWCHVMARECFSDEEVAEIMNENFVNIKVDREEYPDVDNLYITAVQLMTQQAGWPLNCFALPDKRPVYGGTYFPREAWIDVLNQLSSVYRDDPEKVGEYASRLEEGLRQVQLIPEPNKDEGPDQKALDRMVGRWSNHFDQTNGGPQRAPKFPLPNNYQFLLRYSHFTEDAEILSHTELTLKKMGCGGIRDQVGGGFSRYSTDMLWKVPHFEKMLYDNAQMVSLYAEAYEKTADPFYASVVHDTLGFIEREMSHPDGGFYSAIDADSDGEEGKFYIWEVEELKEVLGDRFELAKDFFEVNEKGKWQNDKFILLRTETPEEVASKHGLTPEELHSEVEEIRRILLQAREQRIRPELDHKIITAWNALMIKGYFDAYEATGQPDYKETAMEKLRFLLEEVGRPEGGTFRIHKDGTSQIPGYLDDHAFLLEALIAAYQNTFNEEYIDRARELTSHIIEQFMDEQTGLFFFTAKDQPTLVTPHAELTDNVIPASNSALANALFDLGHLTSDMGHIEMATRMLSAVQKDMTGHGEAYSNWGMLALKLVHPYYEVAIVGPEAESKRADIARHYLPNSVLAGSREPEKSKLELLNIRENGEHTSIHVCTKGSCQLPVSTVKEALEQIQKG